MRYLALAVCMLLGTAVPAPAHADIGFDTPGLSIGISLPVHPRLARIPGYPVYYAPALHLNLFYYNGRYWLFEDGNWYASAWTDGPWQLMAPYDVPGYILRIPVRYYLDPPSFFYGWNPFAPPLWGEHWGREWREHRHDWHRGHRLAAPEPLPQFRRFYAGAGFPRIHERPHEFDDHHDFDRSHHFGREEHGDHDDRDR